MFKHLSETVVNVRGTKLTEEGIMNVSPIVDLDDVIAQQVEIGIAEEVDSREGRMRAAMWRQDCGSILLALSIQQQHSLKPLLRGPHRWRHLLQHSLLFCSLHGS